jgi:formate dehydrogenase subunit gamma
MGILKSLFTAAVAAVFAFIACAVWAQSPAVNPAEADAAKMQQQRQTAQPLNNQPVWSEVRSGQKQYTSVAGRETDVLMQPQGQTWRALRNGEVSVYGGWALVLMVLTIAGFYWRKGTLELHGAPTGRKIRRFTPWERVIHWSTAGSFVILAFSGLIILFGKNLLLPLIGYTLFSWLAILAKNLHNFVGPLFIVCVILLLGTFIKDNFPKAYDLNWIKHFGGLISGRDVPSGRFNAGEKLWFWGGALFLGAVVGVSGLVLDFPNFDQTRATMQLSNIVHLVGATLFMLGALGHIYMGTLGMRGAYDAMRTGYVDETWAKEHHEYWYNDIKEGRISAGDAESTPSVRERIA